MKSAPLPSDEAERLASLRALDLLDSLPEAEYDDVAALAAAICGTPIALITLVDQDRQWFKARVGLDAPQTSRDVAFCAHAILQQDPFVVNDAAADARFADNPLVTGQPHIRFYAGAPLLAPDGHAIGTLCVIDRAPRALDAEQAKALGALSRQVTRLLALRVNKAELEAANARLVAQELALRQTAAELRENVARFRGAFDQNAVGMLLVDVEGRLMSVNRAFVEMLGYSEEELTGQPVSAFLLPDDATETRTRIRDETKDLFEATRRFVRKDGAVVWTESASRRLRDEEGRPLYWVSHVQDVTRRKEAEDRLQAQYIVARILADATSFEEAAPQLLEILAATGGWDIVGIFEADETQSELRIAAVEIFAHEVPGARDLLRGFSVGRGAGVAGQAWATGRSIWVEDLARHSDAASVAASQRIGMRAMLAVPIFVEGVLTGVIDLLGHAPRREDEATRLLAEALAAQIGSFLTRRRAALMRRRLGQIVETTTDFVAIADTDAQVLYINGAGRALLEIPPEVPAKELSMQAYLSSESEEELRARIRQATEGDGRWSGEIALRSRSGREVPVSAVVLVTKAKDGTPLSYACMARDITEAKKVERMKNEFVSTVSHELRTPLTSIRGALGLLEGGVVGSLDQEAIEIVHIARTNSDRLIRLINDMLDLDKIQAGKLEMSLRDTDASSLAEGAIDSVRGMAQQADVRLKAEVDPTLRVRVDVDRMLQALVNLLSNAVKFSPRGSSVTLRAAAREGRARFEVVDRGPGIPPELRARLFQKFQQLDSSDARAKGGTGLGLAISKAIVEQLGGAIGVESSAAGSTFWLEVGILPPPRPAGRSAKVLLVEDDPRLRDELAGALRELGVAVLQAEDGAVAIHLARSEAPDLVVLDLGIPRPDGFEVVGILRDGATRSTPLLVHTGRELTAADRQALTLGPTRYLTKTKASLALILATARELLGHPQEAQS